MNVYLMFRDHDFNPEAEHEFDSDTLASDLELKRIFEVMSLDDKVIASVCASAMLHPLQDKEEILYRQAIVMDSIANPEAVRTLYGITIEAQKRIRQSWSWLSLTQSVSCVFSSAVSLLKIYVEMLLRLRKVAENETQNFHSDGFIRLLTMLQSELNDTYFHKIKELLHELENGRGMLISATLGSCNQGVNYVLRRKETDHFRRHWFFAPAYTLSERDDAGFADLSNRRERAVNESSNALAQASEHVGYFFKQLRQELAFYAGCLNLHEALHARKMPAVMPEILPPDKEERSYKFLYDPALALTTPSPVTGNGLDVVNKRLYIITGANQGGKSTCLRSVGQAQLMMQCGMFVGAEKFTAPIRKRVFTHFKKEEDKNGISGKLDEELARMDEIASHLEPECLVLFNESFAATNEREGSEICRQITSALVENGIEVFSVTHLYTYAASFLGYAPCGVQYLKAERTPGNRRTFKIISGEPEPTAFGKDLYHKIFEDSNNPSCFYCFLANK
ncbi:MAG: Endonuclease MutS2 [Lentisphaerae bacterium ADurb.Bin242]|nr:MAG: Endonuclease MutS2 [Lentisphaerae bacterium ADurb.Bin242]